ncbi:P-loop ATPase, Sll1717 family [Corallincola platygyrae]|uniref:P-loop ATPase, Sll1717 family n=1 Tax=Corallincola platygyrae TaxID=1193278 RepID=A0ABW4XNH5_9GAMM
MLFGNLARGTKNRRLFLGAPEAEAEALEQSRMKLTDVYEDWHDLFNQLSHEKFIVIGRKGAGKSAFAQFAYAKSLGMSNLFVDFVKQDRINLEELVQIGNEKGHDFEKESIFKWLIYTHLIRLFSESEAAKDSNDFEQLRQFLRKNTGFVDITETDLVEITQNKGFEVNVEPLKRFYRQKIKKEFSIKSQKAVFYKLLPHLEEVIKSVLTSRFELDNENSYVIFFDDLDVGFDINNRSSVDSIVSLLRVAKYINNDFFSKNKIKAKAVILLRDDVEKYVGDKYPDTAKMMASYAAPIKWYQDDFQRGDNESDLNIRKFIDLRIRKAFEKAELPCNQSDPWKSLVDTTDNYQQKSSFKYVLDHTLFRPRDLLLLFLPLESGESSVPLSKQQVNDFIGTYASQLVKEFRSEISSFYSDKEVSKIFKVLRKIHNDIDCNYECAIKYMNDAEFEGKDSSDVLEDLFERSIIGSKYSSSNFKFKYREPLDGSEIYSLDPDADIVMHYGFRAYFNNQRRN